MVGTGEATNGPEFSDVTGPGDVLPVTDRADSVRDDRARAKRDISKCLELQSFFFGFSLCIGVIDHTWSPCAGLSATCRSAAS